MRFLTYVVLALFAREGIAALPAPSAIEVAALAQQARSRGLADHPYWRALLHYRRSATGTVASEIVSADFFLSPSGSSDPAAELESTIIALFTSPGEAPDSHAQCRFVARYQWLRKSMEWPFEPPAVPCRQFQAYAMQGQIESLSLVYATGYLSNPASFYGHILLKFNTHRSITAHDLLDRSVNFGATIPPGENPVFYVLKGLLGGYDASFSHHQFYRFNHAYAENELRDMWEYVLALDKEEVDQIVAHSWELLGKNFVYYFLKENCAYRMAELLALVVDAPLVPDLPWALPGAVFERIASLERDGRPLVREVRRIPSRHNRFRRGYLALPLGQQSIAKSLVASELDFASSHYPSLHEAEKVDVVDTLLDYYEYRIASDKDDAEAKRAKQQLLLERIGLPARPAPDREDYAPRAAGAAPPHEGPLPFLVRLGPLDNSRLGAGIRLGVRPASYDSLALDAGRIPDSTLAMFDLDVVYVEDSLLLRKLHFVNIENLNIPRTSLPRDGGLAWNFRLGFESQDLSCRHCTIFKLGGGLGRAIPVGPKGAALAMLDLSAQTEHETSETVAATPRIGLIASPALGWKTSLSLGRRSYLNGARSAQRMLRWENRIGGERRWDLRIVYEEHVAREFSVAASLYW